MHILQSKLKKKRQKSNGRMGEGAPVVDPPTFSTENFDTEIKKKYPRQLWLFVSLIKLRNKLKVTDSIVILSLQDNITLID